MPKKTAPSAIAHDPAAIARDLRWRLGDVKTAHEDEPSAVLCAAAWFCEAVNLTEDQERQFLLHLGLRWTRTSMGGLVLTDKPAPRVPDPFAE